MFWNGFVFKCLDDIRFLSPHYWISSENEIFHSLVLFHLYFVLFLLSFIIITFGTRDIVYEIIHQSLTIRNSLGTCSSSFVFLPLCPFFLHFPAGISNQFAKFTNIHVYTHIHKIKVHSFLWGKST